MSALLAATSTVVFSGLVPGVASASPGTIKVGGYPADNSGNGNDPHVNTACVGIRTFDMDTSKALTVTFSLQAPTKGNVAPLVVSATATAGVLATDVQDWLSKVPAAKQGYHISVDVAGKQKTFWVDSIATGCPKPVDPCVANAEQLGTSLPAGAAGVDIPAGSGIGMSVTGTFTEAQLNPVFTVDGAQVGPVYPVDNDGNGTIDEVWYVLPGTFPFGAHTASLRVGDPATNCALKTWSFTSVALGGSVS